MQMRLARSHFKTRKPCMAETHFKIVFEGQVRDGVEPEVAKANLARLFKS